MKRSGFTLIELLVVIAIISILAAILVPNIAKYLARTNAVKAHTDINAIDLALGKMLSDTGKQNFGQFFQVLNPTNTDPWPKAIDIMTDTSVDFVQAVQVYDDVFYKLLRQGRNADLSKWNLALRPEVQQRLGESYLDLQKDPWGNLYQFYAGPWPPRPKNDITKYKTIQFRCAVPQNEDAETGLYPVYVYDGSQGKTATINMDVSVDARNSIAPHPQEDVPGQTRADGGIGYPAPTDLPVYIWSMGQDLLSEQYATIDTANDQYNPAKPFDIVDPTRKYWGGGDDVNNWDKNSGWSGYYGG